jgi:cyclopropane fatty-acyl-phospholipid synthase-like methyltransferase
MFEKIKTINQKPKPFEFYTAAELWTNEHTSNQMLTYHLNDDVEASSRNSAFITKSVDWIINKFKINADSKVIDFGCAVGHYTNALAATGASVTGIDFNATTLDYARQQASEKGLNVNYIQADYNEFETEEKFDLVIMIMCDFCALNPMQRAALLKKFKVMLTPGGAVLMDVYTLNAFDKKTEDASYEKNQLFNFWSAGDYYTFINSWKYEAEKVALDKYVIIEDGKADRVIYNWLQHFSQDSLKAEFEAAGLNVKGFYGNVAGSEYDAAGDEMAIVAGRPCA